MGTEILDDPAPDEPHDDRSTTLAELRACVEQFVAERHWQTYHAPKNLAMSLAIESAELMEHFQWVTVDESRHVADDTQVREAVLDELADVFCYVLAMANALNADLTRAFRQKMRKNARKYPAPDTTL
ncbi:MAG: NTP pyrophosphohydrolase [Pirellulaceae bacterium]|nr:MAG: NTP pyrophosphohydrolase [Pirellulaceae bacterium]